MVRTSLRLSQPFALLFPLLTLLFATAAFAAGDATATRHDAHSAFEALKSMAGTWVGTVAVEGADQSRDTTVTYRVSANGHSVIQTFSPGSEFEMFSVYHMDGDELLMTHYCAIGNAPKMRFAPSDEVGTLEFAFDGGTNFDPAKDAHAHEGQMRLLGDDAYESVSVGWADGGPSQVRHFSMRRVDE